MNIFAFFNLALLCSCIFSISSVARSCDAVDLHSPADSPLRKMPVYDQDGAGICYAYAAAQLFNFEKIKSGNFNDQVSPIAAAETNAFRSTWSDSNIIGGDPSHVLSALNKNGYCTVQETEKLLRPFKQGENPLMDSEIVALFAEYAKGIAESNSSEKRAFREASAQIGCHRGDSLAYISEFMGGKNTQRELFQAIFDECPKREAPVKGFDTFGGQFGDPDFLDHVDEALSSGRPIAIDYCADLQFSQKKKIQSPPEQALREGNCGLHASLVTAQRKTKSGGCQLLIRNSWGPDWRGSRGTSCACITETGEYQENCLDYSNAKEVVGCWQDREELLENMYGVTYRRMDGLFSEE